MTLVYIGFVNFNKISIHTPAKGVTSNSSYSFVPNSDFNPHSREGSDASSSESITAIPDFNPHSREGSDDISAAARLQPFNISIHTPAKGVTLKSYRLRSAIYYFNPHSREGSDNLVYITVVKLNKFQSTLPQRE